MKLFKCLLICNVNIQYLFNKKEERIPRWNLRIPDDKNLWKDFYLPEIIVILKTNIAQEDYFTNVQDKPTQTNQNKTKSESWNRNTFHKTKKGVIKNYSPLIPFHSIHGEGGGGVEFLCVRSNFWSHWKIMWNYEKD